MSGAEAQLTHTFLLSESVSLLEFQLELWTISEHEPCCEHTDRKVGKRLLILIISFCFVFCLFVFFVCWLLHYTV